MSTTSPAPMDRKSASAPVLVKVLARILPCLASVPQHRPPAAPAAAGGGYLSLNVQGLPLIKPPYGTISAISLDTGDIVWQIAHGETPDNIRNHPALKGLDIPRTGQMGYNICTLITKTLVIAGDGQITNVPGRGRGAMLRAYDKSSGKEVGSVLMPAPETGSPMTYMWKGKQYIVIAVSGGAYSGEYLAFTLPEVEDRVPTSAAGNVR